MLLGQKNFWFAVFMLIDGSKMRSSILNLLVGVVPMHFMQPSWLAERVLQEGRGRGGIMNYLQTSIVRVRGGLVLQCCRQQRLTRLSGFRTQPQVTPGRGAQ